MTQRPLGAQISHMLKDRGVDVIFGIPGVHNQEMYRGIEKAGITHVLARHEQGAGFMADGYARATGKPGVAYVITGPGLCNIMTPMGQAYSDSVPMLVISSCLDETAARHGQLHQMIDQNAAAAAVCDWSRTTANADAAYQLVDRAFLEFETKRPRPKHLSLPIKALEGPGGSFPALASVPPVGAVDTVSSGTCADLLKNAQKPFMIVGGGARKPARRLADLVRRMGVASMSTYAGRGVIPATDPLHFGSFLARPDSGRIIAEADVVFAIGTELSEVDLWRDELADDVPLIRIDIDPEMLCDAQNNVMIVQSDAAAWVAAVDDALAGVTINSDWSADQVQQTKTKWRSEIDMDRPGILPVADALKEALPVDAMIYSDMTQFAYAAKEVYPMDRPGHWHHPYGFGTLGYALPAAIGGKIGCRDQPVIAIMGDYGFQYTVQELAVAVELELTLPIIIWDNGKLGEIEDSMVRAQIAPNAVVQRNPDFCKLAEAYSAASAAPQSLPDLKSAITTALATKGPTIIHVKSDIAGVAN
ncbi:5-guanidino-2-oxopentanoate decarboxylase [Yoonia sediminilitoris]|uniref:Acetolactate synthase-1/2/3 large subunit/5-guanidino-2-oxopentanoate decarboxylase n=1 Tax=Yoonia sediminilitoris TaxID=1286148 RepID=A0A2T6KEL1_9RHOB|nr:5-guanidino-2-oxopentanoate decarboxylase [Yoonia sediminilitoris]PUB13572.1 acetolactate synthase-1/2/3 large subunit/5-guanidino-2-oxopentanoate decarboxylase [Yoonia sediminilitoris]RCW94742.1 acetolactate synthase-1/2/3 large subunit/5-guanidino-2-oxopentanoate decarboxylase [Yoonia sediminilitoris]